jgi:hypothetical protein
MRDRIRKRLKEYRAEALHKIAVAVTGRKLEAGDQLNNNRVHLFINEDTKAGFADHMDQSASFIRQVAPGSSAEYSDELRDDGNKLKQEIMAKVDRENYMATAFPGNSTRVHFRNELDGALDSLIERKLEDFQLGYIERREMSTTIQNTVNIVNSQISNSVVQITQSGKDTISKETALKLQELVNSEEIKGLPDDDRLEVLDRVSDLIEKLQAPTTDDGRVVRGLKSLSKFILTVASSSMADFVAQVAIAYATAKGMI